MRLRVIQPAVPRANDNRARRGDPPIRAHKWRCPTGECSAKSMSVRADRYHPLIPRESKRYKQLYRQRTSVEREFGRLKHEWALLPLRVRGMARVQLHADLTILACLACRLNAERVQPVRA